MKRPKIAIIHPHLVIGGGSEACALWIMEALKDAYELHLITSQPVDFEQFNIFYRTNVKPHEVQILVIPTPLLLRRRFSALKIYRLARYCKKHSVDFDLMFSIYGAMDFGCLGIQYIHEPVFNEKSLKMINPSPDCLGKLIYRDNLLRKCYIRLSDYLSDYSVTGMKRNLTLVNSNWTGQLTQEEYCIPTYTVYPPVLEEKSELAWDEKENGFLLIGRIVPEKQIERTIDILTKVRKSGFDVHLHIIGKVFDSEYLKRLNSLIGPNRNWIYIEGSLSDSEKSELLKSHKYGIHGKEYEPFGITIAEMVKAGCIIWVPAGGGQREIVDHAELVYDSVEDAVNKIKKVLTDEGAQSDFRRHLAERATRYSTERFITEIREKVQWSIRNNVKEY